MGFVALLLIVMAIIVLTRVGKPTKVIEREPEPEKILVERGFEKREVETEAIQETKTDSIETEKEVSGYEETEKKETIEVKSSSESLEEILSDQAEDVVVDSPIKHEFDDDVKITSNQTFYDSTLEESEPELIEPMDTEFEIIEEVELTPIDVEPATDNIDLEITEQMLEKEPLSLENGEIESLNRIRKPVIDESDPTLKIDLGVEICPHCGSNVPDTIYCIYCGKALDPDNIIEESEK
jgi:hypothetical protein